MSAASDIRRRLAALADPAVAEHSRRFFKTGRGEYGEGDRFLGIRVPVLRKEIGRFAPTPLGDIGQVLDSPFHEERLFALLLLVRLFGKGGEPERRAIYDLYLARRSRVNNWDLVDSSAPHIVGAWLEARDRRPLYELAESGSLWDRRIAIVSTFHFIRRGSFDDTLQLSFVLKNDREDLIHKAVGWMLREVGKRDPDAARAFLRRHASGMPRTMLRYAIERFPGEERKAFLLAGRS